MKTISTKNIIKYAGAIVALLIGSGFATGQEVIQYFTAFGWQGLSAAVVMFILMTYVMVEFITVGEKEKFKRGNDIYYYYCGKTLGTFYDYFSSFFLFLSFIVMIAGAGATGAQHFGLPNWVGGVLLGILAVISCITGLKKIVDIIGGIGPVIVIIALLLGIYTIFANIDGLRNASANIAALDKPLLRATSNWFISAVSYVGFCMLWLAAFVSQMGKNSDSRKEAISGSVLGSLAFCLAVLVIYLALLSKVNLIAGSQIPNLILAKEVHPLLPTIFSIMIFLGIYTTAVPLLWSVVARLSEEGTPKFKSITLVLGAIGIVIGVLIKFDKLINIIYGLNGYVGILLLIIMIAKTIMRKRQTP